MNENVQKVFGAMGSMANGAAAVGAAFQTGIGVFDQLQQQQQQMQTGDWSRRMLPPMYQPMQAPVPMYQPASYPWARQEYNGFGQPQQSFGYNGISDPGYGFTAGYNSGMYQPQQPSWGNVGTYIPQMNMNGGYADAMWASLQQGGWRA